MRVDEYLIALSFLDKPSPWMTSFEKSNREQQKEEKEVTQRGVVQTPREEFRIRLRQTELQAMAAAALSDCVYLTVPVSKLNMRVWVEPIDFA